MKVGDSVVIRTRRPHVEQYNGCTGKIVSISVTKLVYLCIGTNHMRTFYLDELELATTPVEGGAA